MRDETRLTFRLTSSHQVEPNDNDHVISATTTATTEPSFVPSQPPARPPSQLLISRFLATVQPSKKEILSFFFITKSLQLFTDKISSVKSLYFSFYPDAN